MTDNSCIEPTWANFLSYALTGALAIVTGMVIGSVAGHFNLLASSMSNTFIFLNAGILISISLNAWLMEIVPLKTQLRSGFPLMVLAIAGLMFSRSLTSLSAMMFILGVVSSITMSTNTFLVTQVYEGRQRGSRLLFIDSFFSVVGVIFPMITAFLLAHSIEWYWIYVCIGLVHVATSVLTFGCELPALGRHAPRTDTLVKKEKRGINVLFLSAAVLYYILGQLDFISWVPEYAKGLGTNLNDMSTLVGNFQMSYMVSMQALNFILRFFDPQHILTVLAGLTTILMYVFNTGTSVHMAWSILALGFFSSTIYATIITLGSQQTKVSSLKLANFVLTCRTIDTMLTFMIIGPIVEHNDPQTALLTVNGLYAVVFVMCFLLGLVSRHRQHSTLISH